MLLKKTVIPMGFCRMDRIHKTEATIMKVPNGFWISDIRHIFAPMSEAVNIQPALTGSTMFWD